MRLAVGDMVVYGSHGAGPVAARETRIVLGRRQEVIVLALANGLSVELPRRSAAVAAVSREQCVEKIVQGSAREADRVVGGAVVHAHLAARCVVQEAAGEDDVGHVAGAFVRLEGCEDPVGKASQDARRLGEIEEGEADPVHLAGDRVLHALIAEGQARPRRSARDCGTG